MRFADQTHAGFASLPLRMSAAIYGVDDAASLVCAGAACTVLLVASCEVVSNDALCRCPVGMMVCLQVWFVWFCPLRWKARAVGENGCLELHDTLPFSTAGPLVVPSAATQRQRTAKNDRNDWGFTISVVRVGETQRPGPPPPSPTNTSVRTTFIWDLINSVLTSVPGSRTAV